MCSFGDYFSVFDCSDSRKRKFEANYDRKCFKPFGQLMKKIGHNTNRVNRLYEFILPKYLRKEESKKQLEKNINQITANYQKALTRTQS